MVEVVREEDIVPLDAPAAAAAGTGAAAAANPERKSKRSRKGRAALEVSLGGSIEQALAGRTEGVP